MEATRETRFEIGGTDDILFTEYDHIEGFGIHSGGVPKEAFSISFFKGEISKKTAESIKAAAELITKWEKEATDGK